MNFSRDGAALAGRQKLETRNWKLTPRLSRSLRAPTTQESKSALLGRRVPFLMLSCADLPN